MSVQKIRGFLGAFKSCFMETVSRRQEIKYIAIKAPITIEEVWKYYLLAHAYGISRDVFIEMAFLAGGDMDILYHLIHQKVRDKKT